jgi:hypothetical protein
MTATGSAGGEDERNLRVRVRRSRGLDDLRGELYRGRGAVDGGERRAQLMRHGCDQVGTHLLENALAADVAERIDGADEAARRLSITQPLMQVSSGNRWPFHSGAIASSSA